MEQLTALHRSRQLILGAGILLLIDMFLNWQKVSVEFGGEEIASASRSGWHGFWGVVLGIATIAILIWVLTRTFEVEVPGSLPDGLVTLALGGIILICAVLKNLIDDYSAWPAYVGVVLAAIVFVGAWMWFQETGESLPSMPTAAKPAAATGGAGAATTAPPAETPAAPSEPMAAEPEAPPDEAPPESDSEAPPPGSTPA